MANNQLTIHGFGLASAAGPSLSATMEGLVSGKSLILRHDAFFDTAYDNQSCIFTQSQTLPGFEARIADLISASWADCFLVAKPADSVKIIVLLPESDPLSGLPKERVVAASVSINQAIMQASEDAGLQVLSYAFINKGQASLGAALQMAAQEGASDHIIVGADSFCDRDRLAAASQNGLLFSARDKWGAIPGEAGGVLWVSPLPKDGISLTVLSACVDREEIVERNLSMPSDHSGLSRAVRGACEALGNVQCSRWLSDMNNNRYRSSEVAYAMHRAMPFWLTAECDLVHVPMTFGECGTAYGFLAILGAANRSPGSVTIVSASAVHNDRSAFIVQS
jgi:hypothetical protein